MLILVSCNMYDEATFYLSLSDSDAMLKHNALVVIIAVRLRLENCTKDKYNVRKKKMSWWLVKNIITLK